MGVRVLLPTSGLGSRIGDLTEHTNKALVRVGTKPTLSYIIESYPADAEFIVMLGHKGKLVHEFLHLAYPDRKFTYMDVEIREGNKGLLPALKLEENKLIGPFIFHACDTITQPLPREFIESETNMALGYPISGDASQYRLIRHSNGEVERIMDKGEMHSPQDLIHIGVAKFVDMALFWECLYEIVAAEPDNKSNSDTHMINAMIAKGATFKTLPAATWYDTGNVTRLEEARAAFGTDGAKFLEKVDQAVYLFEDRVIKFFAADDEVYPRVQRAQMLGDAVPKILGSTQHFFVYEKAKGTIGTGMNTVQMLAFLDWCEDTLWHVAPSVNWLRFTANCHAFYHTKTLDRLTQFRQKTGIRDSYVVINGVEVKGVYDLLGMVDWCDLAKGIPTATFHGDLHPSNILIDGGSFKLLDWRNGFGAELEVGDVYYDLAKINHGLIVSHDLVDQNLFTVDVEGHVRIDLDILRKQKLIECQQAFFAWCVDHGYSTERIDILTALIFLNIAALHHRPYDKFLYYLGQKMLSEAVR